MAGRRRGNGEGTIYERSSGGWAATLSVGGGKRKTIYAKTRKEAQQRLNDAIQALRQGKAVSDSRQTLGVFLLRWLEEVKQPQVRFSSYRAYQHWTRRLTNLLGDIKLCDLRSSHIQKAYSDVREDLAARSIHQMHYVLKQSLQQAVEWELVSRNHAEHVVLPRCARYAAHTLTVAQLQQLLTATRESRWYPLWLLLASTGMRHGECTGLQWDSVDLESATLTVTKTLHWERGRGLVLAEPKTSSSRRTMHLTDDAVSALRDHRERQNNEVKAAGSNWSNGDFVFCTHHGTPFYPTDLYKAWRYALDSTGLPRVRIHDLRHGAATYLLVQGVHPRVAQEYLGHGSVQLTLSLYSHVLPTMHKEAAMRLGDLLKTEKSDELP
jgi:integrase